ncbi:hypothetical protein TSTA_098780 [Talaromyces stipitatus ATCC 10500]|uniref:Circumsporozoite protein n=1 Tax=Talaromyces stipitatus (strain ATCC 10500 / CBS 375.48 / QM 6759 / NRRL 1006) TaxID=441959 RepID=B8MLP9_TALSN|nr:uncharacterized protein TSTA_098780 [Talaromyces stipitatus ATCC 10500]EED13621.1 hypothetical protein TSTA_098780 [Talaromyces stipitatus ATCC 10500]
MYSKTAFVYFLAAVAEARFGQEQGNGAIAAIQALSNLGQPGQAATLAGGSIQFLLAAANPCGKLIQADKIVSQLGTSDAAIAAARGLVAAEQNFNPFVVSIPSICSDPTLPTTAALRGVVPLIDPAVGGQDIENANSKTSVTTPFDATGLSVAQVMVAHGFSNFTAVAQDGTKVAASALGTSGASTGAASSAAVAVAASSSTVVNACSGPTTLATAVSSAAVATATPSAASAAAGTCTGSGSTLTCSAPAAGARAVSDPVTGTFGGFVASTIAGLDFGLCVPTMKFEAGLDGRSTSESTFQAIDPLINKGQEEAKNPLIIANRIHDQLTNVCGANAAAKSAAAAAQQKLASLGTKDASTADAWNTALGFAGTNTNPDNAPKAGLVGHT